MVDLLNLSKEDYVIDVLNRAKLIIDEYNELLNENNEYAHVNIMKDIDEAIIKLKTR